MSTAESATLNTFNLLKATYKPGSTEAVAHVFDVMKLQEWHRLCMGIAEAGAGMFRRSGGQTQDRSHTYPNHKIVSSVVTKFGELVYRLAKCIDGMTDPTRRFRFVVALAAFIQFHYVDIHPHVDGNGRMCRFLAKYMLDTVFPLPVPLFPDREVYIRALVEGRKVNNRARAPEQLFELLVDVSIASYETMAARLETPSLVGVVVAHEVSDAEKQLSGMPVSDIGHFVTEFKAMEVGQDKIVKSEDGRACVQFHKIVDIDSI
jgi:hypothetical protein